LPAELGTEPEHALIKLTESFDVDFNGTSHFLFLLFFSQRDPGFLSSSIFQFVSAGFVDFLPGTSSPSNGQIKRNGPQILLSTGTGKETI